MATFFNKANSMAGKAAKVGLSAGAEALANTALGFFAPGAGMAAKAVANLGAQAVAGAAEALAHEPPTPG